MGCVRIRPAFESVLKCPGAFGSYQMFDPFEYFQTLLNVFTSFRTLLDAFACVPTCSNVFGCIRTRLDVLGCWSAFVPNTGAARESDEPWASTALETSGMCALEAKNNHGLRRQQSEIKKEQRAMQRNSKNCFIKCPDNKQVDNFATQACTDNQEQIFSILKYRQIADPHFPSNYLTFDYDYMPGFAKRAIRKPPGNQSLPPSIIICLILCKRFVPRVDDLDFYPCASRDAELPKPINTDIKLEA